MDIPKCSLLNPRSFACMFLFKADHLTLENHLIHSSLVKVSSPAPGLPWLPVDPCVELRPHRVSSSFNLHLDTLLV